MSDIPDIFNADLSTGLISVDTDAVQEKVIEAWKEASSGELNYNPETKQGKIIALMADFVKTVSMNNANIANQFNSNYATGTFLDDAGSWFDVTRTGKTFSKVTLKFQGVIGTLIPVKQNVQDPVKLINWETDEQVIIGTDGFVTVDATCTLSGPEAATSNSLTKLVNAPLGVETVTNPSMASVGQDVESDLAFGRKRRAELGKQGTATVVAIESAIEAVEGVTSKMVYSNPESTSITVKGVTVEPKSIYCTVSGGTDESVALAIKESSEIGASYNKDSTSIDILVTDEKSTSKQQQLISFHRPTDDRDIAIRVKITVDIGDVNTSKEDMKKIIMNWSENKYNTTGFAIGRDVHYGDITTAVNNAIEGISVAQTELAKVGEVSTGVPYPLEVQNITINGNEEPSLTTDNIVVELT
jgi:hypothetical protein